MSATITVRPNGAPSDRRPVRSVTPRRIAGASPRRVVELDGVRGVRVRGGGVRGGGARGGGVRGAAASAAAAPHVSEATYRRRRAVVGTALAVLVAASIVLTHDVLAGSGGVPASAAESQPARTRSTVTARPGDTLWAIAARHRGDVPIDRYVDTLVDLNGGASIQAGQAVVVP